MQIGIYSFAEATPLADGTTITPERRLANLLEEIALADEVGLDVFGIGEHHRADYVTSAPAVVLAAAAIAGLVPADSAVLAPVVTVVLVPVAIAAPVLRVPLVAALESPGTRRVLPVAMDRDAARAVRTSARSR